MLSNSPVVGLKFKFKLKYRDVFTMGALSRLKCAHAGCIIKTQEFYMEMRSIGRFLQDDEE